MWDVGRADKKTTGQKHATEQQPHEVGKIQDWSRGGGKSLCDDLTGTQPVSRSNTVLNVAELFFPLFAGFFSVVHCTPNRRPTANCLRPDT